MDIHVGALNSYNHLLSYSARILPILKKGESVRRKEI